MTDSIETPCAACGLESEREHSIHRDGFGEGPEVWLCNGCGRDKYPTCPILWAWIAERLAAGKAMVENTGP